MSVHAGGPGPDPKRVAPLDAARAANQAAVEAWRQAAVVEPLAAPHAGAAFETLEVLDSEPGLELRQVRDQRLGRLATLKRPRGPIAIETFLREARLMARLESSSVPPVYEFGVGPDGRPYLLTKIQRGQCLAALIAEGEIDLRRRVEILLKVARAVAQAHRRQVLSRGLQPEAILVGGHGEVILPAWSAARDLSEPAANDQRALTELASAGLIPTVAVSGVSAIVPGVAGYVAPEVLRGEPADGRADVFVLGLLLQELVDGVPAIEGETEADRVAATIGGERARPDVGRVGRAMELLSLVEAATELERNERPASAALFAEDLEAWLADRPLRSHRPSRLERLARTVRRHPARVLAGLAAILALIPMLALGSLARRARASRVEAEMKGQETVRRLSRKERDRSRRRRARQKLGAGERLSFQLEAAEQSVKTLEEALALDPATPALRLGVARVYRNLGRLERAKAVLESVLLADPDCAEAYLGLFRIECLQSQRSRLPRPAELASRALERLAARRPSAGPAARLAALTVKVAGAEGRARLEAIQAAEVELGERIAAGDAPVELRLQRGRMLAALGRIPESIEALKQAVREQPAALDLRLQLISTAIAMSDFNIANRSFAATRAIYVGRPEVLRLGLRLTATRDLRRLASRVRGLGLELLKASPDDAEAKAWVAEAAVFLGDGEGALRRLREDLHGAKPSARLVEALSQILETLGRQEEAIVEVAPFIDRLDSPRIALRQGERLVRADRLKQALELADRTVRRHPEDPDGYVLRALAALMSGRESEAEEAAERAYVLQPTHSGAHNVMASLADKRGDQAKAAKHLNFATFFRPGSPEGHRMRVRMARFLKQPEQALRLAESGISCVRRDHVRLELQAAVLCLELNRPCAALSWLDSVLDPQRPLPILPVQRANALALRANALRDLGRPGEAVTFATRAFELRSKVQMGSVVVKSHLEAGDPRPAVRYAKALARTDIKNRNAPELLARVLLACDDLAGAERALQVADKIGPETFERLVLRRRLAARLGQPDAEASFARRLLGSGFEAERVKRSGDGYSDQAARLALLLASGQANTEGRLELASKLRSRRPDDPTTLLAFARVLAGTDKRQVRLVALLRARALALPGERVDLHRLVLAARRGGQ